jgi:uncharacterized membrane protein
MSVERDTSFVLKYGSLIGIVIITAGLVMHLADLSGSMTVLTSGIAVIVLTPFAGMVTSFTSFFVNGERNNALTALTLTAITLAGMLIAFYLV